MSRDDQQRAPQEPQALLSDSEPACDAGRAVLDDLHLASPAATLVLNNDGRIVLFNQRARELLRRDDAQLVDTAFREIVHPGCADSLDLFLDSLRESAQVETCEIQVLRADSAAPMDVLVQGRVWRSGEEHVLVLSLSDFSSWRRVDPQTVLVDERLRHSQKMEALGQLSTGIAHDFNNILTIFSGYSRLLLQEIEDEAHRKHLKKIVHATERASELVARMLAFGRHNDRNISVLNLNDHIVKFEDLFTGIVHGHIELRAVLDQNLPNIRINPNQLDQILMNLAINARDAIDHDAGALTFVTHHQYVGKERPKTLRHLAPGLYVVLEVSDNGCGMTAQVASRVFEPFFSTKTVGRGTGLGLATVRNIVRDYGGAVTLETQPGNGSCFRLYFPSADSSADPLVDELGDNGEEAEQCAGTTILVVEENKGVRELIVHVLQGHGYQVAQAGSVDEAMKEALPSGGAPIDLMVVDFGLPLPQVNRLIQWMRAQQPGSQSLFLSGYAQLADFPPEAHALRKPFTPMELLAAVRGALHPG